MQNETLHLIAARRTALKAKREELVNALAQVDAEESELAVTERVLSRLGSPSSSNRVGNVDVQIKAVPNSIPKKGAPRPAGAPTTRVMLETVLAEAEKAGKPGLPPKEMVAEVGRRWWPGVGWNSVMPDAARLVGIKVLARRDGLYVRGPKSKGPEPVGSEPNVSPNGGDGSPLFSQTVKAMPGFHS